MAETFSDLVEIVNSGGTVTIQLDGNAATIRVGGDGTGGVLVVRNPAGAEVFRYDGGLLDIGTSGQPGGLVVRDEADRAVFGFFSCLGLLVLGTQGNGGDILLRDRQNRQVFHVNGDGGVLGLGAIGNAGDLKVRDAANREVLRFEGDFAALRIGNAGNEGDIIVHDNDGREVFHMDGFHAGLRVGAQGNAGHIFLRDGQGNESIHLDGGSGDIVLRNADLAEQFELAEAVDAEPGTVMALGADGRLIPTVAAYDRGVVGVVAGGGRYRPGIVLDHRSGAGRRVPIAMVGKAACRVDAGHGPVRVGDFLASSPTPGCAMRAADPARAAGTVIGKALTPLEDGAGLVDMIVSLQ